jgi:putative NADH-flavin reductase
MMLITLFGATGGTGRQFLDQATKAGHQVTAVVRDPAALDANDVVKGDVMDPAAIAPFIDGRHAVVTAIGSRDARRPTTVQTDSTASIVEAMRATGVRRLIVVSNSGMVTDGDGPLTKALVKPILRRILVHGWTDMRHMEDVVTASGLDWTIIRPPMLTNGPLTGAYRSQLGRNVRGGRRISRANVADSILRSLADDTTVGATVSIAN